MPQHVGSLRECPTLSDPGDCGLPVFSVREQCSPGKNTGACWPILVSMAVQRRSGPEEIPHVQGQRSPSKMVGGANSRLESNPIPGRDAQRAQINLVCARTRDPAETGGHVVLRHWHQQGKTGYCFKEKTAHHQGIVVTVTSSLVCQVTYNGPFL